MSSTRPTLKVFLIGTDEEYKASCFKQLASNIREGAQITGMMLGFSEHEDITLQISSQSGQQRFRTFMQTSVGSANIVLLCAKDTDELLRLSSATKEIKTPIAVVVNNNDTKTLAAEKGYSVVNINDPQGTCLAEIIRISRQSSSRLHPSPDR